MAARILSRLPRPLFVIITAGWLAIWGGPSTVAVSAPDSSAGPPNTGVYDSDPGHLWNRLHQALRVRLDREGQDDPYELDPFLWHGSPYLVSGSGHKHAMALLDEFLAKNGEKLIQEPRKRALLQRDLWALFDDLGQPQWLIGPKKKQEALELARRIAHIIPRLALTADQIKTLPDNFGKLSAAKKFPAQFDPTRPTEPYFPADLWEPNGPWVLLGAKEETPLAQTHMQFFGGRSAFFVFLRLPGGRQPTCKYIADLPGHGREEKPRQLPEGAQVALVRQMLLIDDQGKISPTRVVESLRVRVFLKPTDVLTQQRFLEFKLNRNDFQAKKSSLAVVAPKDKERDHLLFMGRNAGDGRSSVLKSCFHCHQGGIESVQSYQRRLPSSALLVRPTLTPSTREDECARIRDWKKQRYEWGLLQGLAQVATGGQTAQPEGLPVLSDRKRLDDKQLADLEGKLQKLHVQLAPSVVRIFNPKREGSGFSGVIVSSSGEILTCAHHGLPPKTKVMVELADGRKVKATILGAVKQKVGTGSSYYAADVGTVLLDDQGDWPAAKLGRSADLKPGDLCLALGYPNVHKPGQPPLLRVGRNLAPLAVGLMRTTCRIHPGDSGGPLFDLDGRVLGVHTAIESLKTGVNWHSPIENFLNVRERLRAGEAVELAKDLSAKPEPRPDRGGAWEPTAELTKMLNPARDSTVEVLADGKVIALGLIVENDGWVLTKRTELTGPGGPRRLVCRLSDGRQLDARVMGQSREHDLALLKVPGKGLPAVRWGKPAELRVGQLIASLGPGPEPLNTGVVGALRAKNPGTRGDLPISTKAAPDSPGTVFTEFLPNRLEVDEARDLLKAGDLITHLDDVPTPTPEEFVRVRNQRTQAADALAGEWIKLTAARAGKTLTVFLPLVDGPSPLPIPWMHARWNLRKNGFPNVFVHDGAIAHDRCGGPVVDRSGQVVGINIARADPIQTFAIPSDVVQGVIAQLKVRQHSTP